MNTKKLNQIESVLIADKEIQKNISKKLNYYTNTNFINDALCYIKAIKEQRMINVIKSVSASGMSRVLSFSSCEKGTNKRYYQRNYNCLFIALGFTESRNKNGFAIGGCGMDMVFHTNYSIIHKLHRLGFINKKECQ